MAESGNWLAEAVVSFLSGPLYINPVMEYVDQHCLIFTPDEENKLEYTPIHNKFKDLVDQLLTEFITEMGVNPQEFYDVIATQHESDKLTGFVVQTILTVDDFLLFKAMMVKRNIDLTNQVLAAVDAMREIVGGADLDVASDLAPEEEAKMLEEALQLSQILNANEEQTHRLRQLMRALQIEDEDIAIALAIANSLRDQTRMEGELAELEQAVALSMALAEAEFSSAAGAARASGASASSAAPAPLDPLSPLSIGANTAAEKMAAVAAAAEASARALSAQVAVTSALGPSAAAADSAAKGIASLSVSSAKPAAGAAAAGPGLAPLAPGLRQPGASRLAPDSVVLDGPRKPSEDVPSANHVLAAALKDLAAAGEAALAPKAGNVRKAAGYKGDGGPAPADLAAVRQAAQQAAETQRAMLVQRKGNTSDASQQWLTEQKLKLVAQKKAEREAETAAYKKEQGSGATAGPRSVAPTPTQVRSDAELEAKRAALRNKLAQKFKEDLVKGGDNA